MKRLFITMMLLGITSMALGVGFTDKAEETAPVATDWLMIERADSSATNSVQIGNLLKSPGGIGGTTPAAGAFTSLTSTSGTHTGSTNIANLTVGTSLDIPGDIDFGSASLEIPNSTSDMALDTAGQIGHELTDDQLVVHGGAAGEAQGEIAISLLEHIAVTFDPSWAYDQESTYRSLPLIWVGDDAPEGITITEWRVNYVAGDPTTELDADLICDTTPDFNTAANATVMDVLNTTAGASTADTGFDSASCANGSRLYIHFGADPTDANVMIAFDLWYYAEAD